MLRLNLNPAPYWIDLLPGLRLQVVPATTVIVTLAGKDPELAALAGPRGRIAAAPDVDSDGPRVDPDVRFAMFAKALARAAIIGWEGVGDDDGLPIDPTPEAIGALMDIHQCNRAFQIAYVAPAMMVQTEKKDLAPELNGTSVTAPTIAGDVETDPAPSARVN